MTNLTSGPATAGPPQADPAAAVRTAESDSAVEFLTALAPSDPAVKRRAFAALLRAVNREVQER